MANKTGPQIVSINPPIRDFSKFAALGAPTSPQQIAALQDTIDFNFVVNMGTAAETLAAVFGGSEFDISNYTTRNLPSGLNFSTTNTVSNQVACPFLAVALCLTVDADDYSYSLTGQMLDRPANQGANAVATGAAAAYGGNRPATFTHGHDSNKAKAAFMKAYSMRFIVGCNYELVDIPCRTWGESSQPGAWGFGNSLMSPIDDIARKNAALGIAGDPTYFSPQTIVENANPLLAGAPLPPAIVPVQKGQVSYPGIYQGCFPLPNRLVLTPGLGYNWLLYRQNGNETYYQQFIEAMSALPPQKFVDSVSNVLAQQSNVALVNAGFKFIAYLTSAGSSGPSAEFTAGQAVIGADGQVLVTFIADATGALIPRTVYGGEIQTDQSAPVATLAAGAVLPPENFSAVATNRLVGYSDVKAIKSGQLALTFSIKGAMLTPKAALDWYVGVGSRNPTAREMYANTQNSLAGVALKAGFRDGLAGVGETMTIDEAKKLVEKMRELARSVARSSQTRGAGTASRSRSFRAFML